MINALGYDLLFQDVDIVWYRNPVEYFTNDSNPYRDFDMYFQQDGSPSRRYAPYSPNTGFYFVRNNLKTQYFFHSLLMQGNLITGSATSSERWSSASESARSPACCPELRRGQAPTRPSIPAERPRNVRRVSSLRKAIFLTADGVYRIRRAAVMCSPPRSSRYIGSKGRAPFCYSLPREHDHPRHRRRRLHRQQLHPLPRLRAPRLARHQSRQAHLRWQPREPPRDRRNDWIPLRARGYLRPRGGGTPRRRERLRGELRRRDARRPLDPRRWGVHPDRRLRDVRAARGFSGRGSTPAFHPDLDRRGIRSHREGLGDGGRTRSRPETLTRRARRARTGSPTPTS